MTDKIIDLRSDTVTKPSAAMRRAMAEAEVGDDVYIEDPTVNRLQDRAAEIFGREAGLFVPSGSMGNLTCIMAQTEHGQEVICEAAGHIYNYEMASMAALAGVLPRVIPTDDGIMTWEQIAPAIREKAYTRPQTALVALENTHNMAGGTVYPTRLAHAICDKAHESGLKVHLDGARVFNAAVHVGQSVAEISKKFDSVQFCFSKGLGAPVGSMIVGSRDFIERCRVIRKMLGGGMRQVGVLAAAAAVALEEGPKRLSIDHDNAQLLAQGLANIPRVRIQPEKVQTNIVIFDI
ncbi:MAG TPA: GntG family PLP-dependent aldolase, partial [Candidatus Binatia bacterium]|nr:GntG family PLP-dependent aldolase [Candidatus Binatia bacterium]